MTDGARGGGIGCLKAAGYGCVGLLLLGVVAGVGVWAGWDLLRQSGVGRGLRETVDAVKSESAAVVQLRQRLLELYPAADLRPNVQIHHADGATTRTLELTVVDPRFAVPADDAGRLAQAREIARAAVAVHPGVGRYDRLRLVVTRRSGDGGVATSTDSYEFAVGELDAPEPPPAASP
jgi:hypothetical protein